MMNKYEFLDTLGRSLKGKIDDAEYSKQMDYYSSYFDSEMNSGRSEQDILEELGDPRLIAKTIVTTYGFNDDKIGKAYMHENGYSDSNEGVHEEKNGFFPKLKKYAVLALILIIIFITIAATFRLLTILLPVLFIFIAITLIFAMFRK